MASRLPMSPSVNTMTNWLPMNASAKNTSTPVISSSDWQKSSLSLAIRTSCMKTRLTVLTYRRAHKYEQSLLRNLQVNSASEYDENLDYARTGHDISCNLGSLNIAHTMDSPDFARTVETAVRGLTAVSDMSHIRSVPSIEAGNAASHAIGLGR